MSVTDLIADLRARGVELWVEDGALKYRAPKGALPDNLRAAVRAEKDTVIAALSADASGTEDTVDTMDGFNLTEDLVDLSSVTGWRIEDQPAYVHRVAPYKGFLYQRLGMDREFVKGEGCRLIDAEGREVIDFIAQYGAAPFGHSPDQVWDALDRLRRSGQPNLTINAMNGVAGRLAEKLIAVAPEGLDHVVFSNSGAEAVEAALKLARVRTGRTGVLSTRNGFHGLTLGAVAASGRAFYQKGVAVPREGFDTIAFGDAEALEAQLAAAPERYAIFIVEPIQGEGGIMPAPAGYLARAAEICRRYGVLFAVDEVQTGMGRTGALFAIDGAGVSPDILILAKALGGGLATIGATLYARAAFCEAFDIRHGSTMAGNALACAAAEATLDLLVRDDRALIRDVAETGTYLAMRLEELAARYPARVGERRGEGFMQGLDLTLDTVGIGSDGLLGVLARQQVLMPLLISHLLNVEGIRIAASYSAGTTLRIEPPLIATRAECDALVGALERMLEMLESGEIGPLIGPFVGRTGPQDAVPPAVVPQPLRVRTAPPRRFAFVVHLIEPADIKAFDPGLDDLTRAECEILFERIGPFLRPFPALTLDVPASDGLAAEGELLVLPFTAQQMLAMGSVKAQAFVQRAVDLAGARGAEVIGLGGFSSIVTGGGLALTPPAGVRLTSGNSLTAWAACQSVRQCADDMGAGLSDAVIAVAGAGGAIGEAICRMLAPVARELILVGRPKATAEAQSRLGEIADACSSLAGRPGAAVVVEGLDTRVSGANVVFAATSDPSAFIRSEHLSRGAIVCDVSRPFNVARDAVAARPDLTYIEGGTLMPPTGSVLGPLVNDTGALVACASETIVLTLSDRVAHEMCGRVDPLLADWLGTRALDLGFCVDQSSITTPRAAAMTGTL